MSRWWTRAWQLGAVALLLAVGYLTLHRDDGAVTAQRLGLPFPAVMAHRGASYLAPEETAWAYRVAKLVGADYLEADIQRSKDGVLIALHDDTLLRTTNVATVFPDRAQQPVSEFTWERASCGLTSSETSRSLRTSRVVCSWKPRHPSAFPASSRS